MSETEINFVILNGAAAVAMSVIQIWLFTLLHAKTRPVLLIGRAFLAGWFLPTVGLVVGSMYTVARQEPFVFFGINTDGMNGLQNLFAWCFICWLVYVKHNHLYGGAFEAKSGGGGLAERVAQANRFADLLSAIRGAPGILVFTEKNSGKIWVASRYTSKALGWSHSILEDKYIDEIQRSPADHQQKREGLAADVIAHRNVEAMHKDGSGVPVNLGVANVSVVDGKIGVAVGKLPIKAATE